jgi:hypothetical protein
MAVYIVENTLKPLSLVNTMSSTANVQNLLTNVFRPRFTYNTITSNYQTKLELANIDTLSANAVTTYALNVGDTSGNVYVGVSAGNDYSLVSTKGSSNNTFVGTGAGSGASNAVCNVSIGYNAGSAISGNRNIFIGSGTTGASGGSSNIYIGTNLPNRTTSWSSNILQIGNGTTPAIIGDMTGNRVGINLSDLPTTTPPIALDINGFTRIGTNNNGMLGINVMPTTYHLDINGSMRIQDGVGTLTFSNGTQTSTGGFTSATGATTGSTTTIPLKKGMFIVSAISNMSVHGYVGISYDSSHQTVVSSNAGGLITSNAGNVTIAVNTTWTVTYFPSP